VESGHADEPASESLLSQVSSCSLILAFLRFAMFTGLILLVEISIVVVLIVQLVIFIAILVLAFLVKVALTCQVLLGGNSLAFELGQLFFVQVILVFTFLSINVLIFLLREHFFSGFVESIKNLQCH